MYNITPLGSCRITNPLRQARENYGFSVNLNRVYGYTHSAAEAVQMAKFFNNDYVPVQEIWPMIAPAGNLLDVLEVQHKTSDLYVIEVSSMKEILLGEHLVQLNYLNRHFEPLFSDRSVAQVFWSHARGGSQKDIDDFLASIPHSAEFSDSELALLRQVRMQITREPDLRQQIRTLLEMLPEVLFVTHVNADRPDGLPIRSRSEFIDMVTASVEAEGGRVYNPTPLMRKVGQVEAIEDHSDSLAHYTPYFGDLIIEEWHENLISGLIDQAAIAGPDTVAMDNAIYNLTARLEAGDAAAVERRSSAIMDAVGPVSKLNGLLARALHKREDDGKARETLRESLVSDPENAELWELFTRYSVKDNQLDDAVVGYDKLMELGVDVDADQVFELAEKLRAQATPDLAIRFYEIAYDKDPYMTAAAENAVALALEFEIESTVAKFAHIVENPPRFAEPLLLVKLALATADKSAIHDLLIALATQSLNGFLAILNYLNQIGERSLVSEALPELCELHDGELTRYPEVQQMIAGWFEAAKRSTDSHEEMELVAQVLDADPKHKFARIRQKSLRKDLIVKVRELYDTNDAAALERLLPHALKMLPPVVEAPIFLIRLRIAAKDWARASDVASRALQVADDNTMLWALQMRSALGDEDYIKGFKAAKRVLELVDDTNDRLREEAELRLSRIPAQAVRAAREHEDPFMSLRLLELSKLDPELDAKVEVYQNRAFRTIVRQMRALEADRSPEALAYARLVHAELPEHQQVQLSMARLLTKDRKYSEAMPFWEWLVKDDPENDHLIFQKERCAERAIREPA